MTYIVGQEVGTFPAGSQFEGGESAYLCVFYGCADIAASNRPGQHVLQSWEWVDTTADGLVDKIQGGGLYFTSGGASLEDEYKALDILHLPYRPLSISNEEGSSVTIESIKQAIQDGTPVLLCAEEESFIDQALGKAPYSWTPTGNHCIVVSGYDSNGNLMVRDYANVGNSWQPGNQRIYLSHKIKAISATAVWPYWKEFSMVPTGWKDDGTTLTSLNGFKVRTGFREYIMSHNWDPQNQPQGDEYHTSQVLLHDTSFGEGQRQLFRDDFLWYTTSRGTVKEPYLGWELDTAYKEIDTLQAQVATLQKASGTQVPVASLVQAASDFLQEVKKLELEASTLTTELNFILPPE